MALVMPIGIWVVSVGAAVALCFVPLFDLLGLESALVMGVVLGIGSALRTDHAFATGRVGRPLDPSRGGPPSGDFFRLLAGHLALLVPTAGVLGLNALRVPNCDPVQGLVFWGVIPAVSIVVGHSLAWLAGAWAARRSLRLLIVAGIVFADVAWFGWRLAWEPSIMGYTLLLGWFPGSLYDEAVQVTPALLWYRLLCLLGAGIVVLGVELIWRRRAGHRLSPWAWGLGAVVNVFSGAWLARGAMGIHLDKADVVDELGGTVETEHFFIHYDPRRIDAQRLPELIEDHEYR
ncbi:MAG: hypothetical protein VX000_16930, partial [Myxococcota bacterium]|nr:hypothetical protein [Myxococcota bacterium]